MTNVERAQLAHFFEGDPAAHALFQQAKDTLIAAFPGARLRIASDQIALCDPGCFAYFWLSPMKEGGSSLVLSFVLCERVEQPPIKTTTFVRPDRIAHHLRLTPRQGIDRNVLSWLKQARLLMRKA